MKTSGVMTSDQESLALNFAGPVDETGPSGGSVTAAMIVSTWNILILLMLFETKLSKLDQRCGANAWLLH